MKIRISGRIYDRHFANEEVSTLAEADAEAGKIEKELYQEIVSSWNDRQVVERKTPTGFPSITHVVTLSVAGAEWFADVLFRTEEKLALACSQRIMGQIDGRS